MNSIYGGDVFDKRIEQANLTTNLKEDETFFQISRLFILGLRRPDANDPKALMLSAWIPEEFVDAILAGRAEYSAELSRRGVDKDSPEAREIIRLALSRHGIQFADTK